ncbi:hypothetical protein KP509_05G038800 [Ceratopteris richardii]|uniref:CST complex subunit STN1 n=1 Tax=Ceratopteris richardii TaxID=49495 RepID=A0A8T2UTW6_CERRI|nr:hypothetical protein KP509_05G038800 [Ceratopteris richardii]KAH7436854.1 hypothetical protein KP509_05G038800 [Ceratopteris richardii]
MAGTGKTEQDEEDYHVHLLSVNFHSLQVVSRPSVPSSSSSCKWALQRTRDRRTSLMVVKRLEVMGLAVAVDRKEKYLRFLLDDGSGACIPCILWLNLLSLTPRLNQSHLHCAVTTQVQAELSVEEASKVRLGSLIRVQGRPSSFNGNLQVTVSSLQVESDPNAELLHWLDCMRLALRNYGLVAVQH